MTMSHHEQIEREEWDAKAYELGCEAAQRAASFAVVDGDVNERRRVLAMLQAGEHVESFLPAPPDLSGLGDGPDPTSLAQDIGVPLHDVLVEEVEAAYLRGVAETYRVAVEAELIVFCEERNTMPQTITVTGEHRATVEEAIGENGRAFISAIESRVLDMIDHLPADDDAKAAIAVALGARLIDGATESE